MRAGGRYLLPLLDVRDGSRSSGVDVVTGHGLAEALQGVECVTDVASGPSPDQQAATEFFTASARNLQMHLSGPIPVRMLRAAQVHEFVGQLVEWGRQDGVSYVQKMRTQLVAARTVAQALADPEPAPGCPGAAPIPHAPLPAL
jgi:hypothetical protein